MNFSISITGDSDKLTDTDIIAAAQETIDKLQAAGANVTATGVNATTSATLSPTPTPAPEQPAP